MKRNPAHVSKFKSDAERKIFREFKKADLELGTVFHSLNIPEHARKQFTEADFVVLSTRGVLILEVKGGRISVRDGIWYTKNADDHVETLKESPLQQVQGAWEGVRNMLQNKQLDIDLQRVNFGYGLMFPDIKLGDIGIELTDEEVFDAIDWDRKNLTRWLEKLYRHWSVKTGKQGRLNEHEVAVLSSALRAEFDRELSLLARVGDSFDQMISLTNQQYIAVDTILENNQVIVVGGAGTGKTEVAIRAAKELAATDDRKVLFLCRSPILASFIRHRLQDTGITVLDLPTLIAKDQTTVRFDALIVDEGQDMLDLNSILFIDSLFPDGMEKGSWYFFMDPNNQSSLYAEIDEEAVNYLNSCGTRIPLKRNCRNTRQIAIHTLLYTGGDIGKCEVIGQGLPVIERDIDHVSNEHLAELVNDQLERWIDEEGVKPGDIVLMSPLEYEESSVQAIDRRWRRKITVVNENFGQRWLDTALPFSTIRDFKGLENKYVMLLDLGSLVTRPNAMNELYVAMTRANTVLWMSVPAKARDWFEARRVENAESLAIYLKQTES